MNIILDRDRTDASLRSALVLDFARASVELSKARRQQQSKDTPAHRVAVGAARDHVDAILDKYLAVRAHTCHPWRRTPRSARAFRCARSGHPAQDRSNEPPLGRR